MIHRITSFQSQRNKRHLVFSKKSLRNYSVQVDKLDVKTKKGVSSVYIPLSKEICSFTIHHDETIGELLTDIRSEDSALGVVLFKGKSGKRLEHDVLVKDLIGEPFYLSIDEKEYEIRIPDAVTFSDSTIAEFEINDIIERSFLLKIQQALKDEERHHMKLEKFLTICSEFGVNSQKAHEFLKSLHNVGVVLYFPDVAQISDTIFLKPERLIESLRDLLELRVIRQKDLQYISRYNEIVQEHLTLNSIKEELSSLANSRATVLLWAIFAYLSVQFTVMGRFVWWEFNWDIVEPISYFVGFATLLTGYLFFLLTKTEFTYDGLRDHLKNRRLRSLYLKRKFDWKRWKELDDEIQLLQKKLDISSSSTFNSSQ